ncbi:LysR substrate-binding domain-containing protein [Ponticaulis profundi]|uniref:LysR substrate-binding domain-containing protein n=1 Tax=Ponticaulis profundi TaxID=2665222 RepID=A0ABW1SCI7_9PROT
MVDDFSLRKIDLNLLHVFEAIYTTGNITKAGEQLNMAQPTVSNALTRLRKQFNDPLFRRADKGVTPTPAARALIGPVRKALLILKNSLELETGFRPSESKRTFNIAIQGFANGFIVPELLSRIVPEAPSVKIRISDIDQMQSEDSLVSGDIDLAINAYIRDRDELELERLHVIGTAIVVRKEHSKIGDTISLEQFNTAKHVTLRQRSEVRQQIDAFLKQLGVNRTIVCEVAGGQHLPQIVEKTDLVAILPRFFAMDIADKYNLKVLDMPFDLPGSQLIVATTKEANLDPAIQWFKGHVLDVVEFLAKKER